MLLASFLGEGMTQQLVGEAWDESRIGMNTLWEANPWDGGGPIVLHSPWWLRAHWGRIFDVVDLVPHSGTDKPAGHGLILLRKKPVSAVSIHDLERLEPGDVREISAMQHQVRQLRRETGQLRRETAEQANALADARGAYDRAQEHIRNLAAHGDRLRQALDALERELEAERRRADARDGLKRELEAERKRADALARAYGTVVNSRSWHVTAPGRLVARKARAWFSGHKPI